MPAPRSATQSLPFVIIFMPSRRMVGHVLFFPHTLQFIQDRAMVEAIIRRGGSDSKPLQSMWDFWWIR